MTIVVRANTGCNLGCTYCYEEADRKYTQAEIDAEYDIDSIIDRLEQFEKSTVKTRFQGSTAESRC